MIFFVCFIVHAYIHTFIHSHIAFCPPGRYQAKRSKHAELPDRVDKLAAEYKRTLMAGMGQLQAGKAAAKSAASRWFD